MQSVKILFIVKVIRSYKQIIHSATTLLSCLLVEIHAGIMRSHPPGMNKKAI